MSKIAYPCKNHPDRYSWLNVGSDYRPQYLCQDCYKELLKERHNRCIEADKKAKHFRDLESENGFLKPSEQELTEKYERIFKYLKDHGILYEACTAAEIDEVLEKAEYQTFD